MSLPPHIVTILFWTLFTIEALAFAVGMIVVFAGGSRSMGPEGPVGAWILFLPPVVLAAALVAFLSARSEGTRLGLVIFLAFPLVMAALGPVRTAILRYQVDRSLKGDDSFSQPSHRALAHAIHKQDLAEVRRCMLTDPADLSKPHGGETLLRFALVNVKPAGSPEEAVSLAIVKAVLDAGADPNVPAFESNWPLTLAIMQSREVTVLLIKAGADMNRLDGAGRPLWWDSLSSESRFNALESMLAAGANVNLRDSESGPAAYAAFFKNWDAAWRLVRAGAKWEGEQRYGQPVVRILQYELESRQGEKREIPESMLELLKLSGL